MDAGAEPEHPELPDRPEEAEGKPKSQETQDDGYETSNSGDALRRKHTSSPEPSPPPAPAPLDPMPPPDPAPPASVPAPDPSPEPERYDALDLHRPDPNVPIVPALPNYYHRQLGPFSQPQPFPLKRDFEEHEPYYRRDDYFKPNFPQPDVYAAFAAAKREHDAPYDMSQQQYLKREHDDYNGIKRECEDPYSFVEEEAMCAMLSAPPHTMPHQMHQQHPHMMHAQQMMLNQPKKRGRKKKIKDENGMEIKVEPGMEGMVVPRPVKERKKHDRFNGMSEEEVSRRTLPDHLSENLDIIIIGINPGLFAAYKGHHYAGPGNHFWKCLYLSGLTREQMSADEDYKLLNFGIGFTNMVSRATKGSADLTRREIKEGSAILLEKLQTFRPKVAVFNGKLIYEVFSGKKDFCFGKQPDTIAGTNTYMWVMPSSSARCAQLPRAADKVPFYAALKKFRDFLNGLVPAVDDAEFCFPDNTARRPQDEQEIRSGGATTTKGSLPGCTTSHTGAECLSCCRQKSNSATRLTMEPDPGDTIILEDGTEVPLKKKRGRPKKIKLENGEVVPPTPRAPRQPRAAQAQLDPNGEQPAKKKRGRPKKIRPEEQQFLLQQQQQQQQQNQQLMSQQMSMGTMNPQPNVEPQPQYNMHSNSDFQSQTLNESLQQNSMMYQNNLQGQVMSQAQSLTNQGTSPYFQGPQGPNTNPMEQSPLDMVQSVQGPLGPMQRPQAGYAPSPGSYSQSPRPQNLAYNDSPRPQGYSQSPQRHQSVTPSYSNSPVHRPTGTPHPNPQSHSPFPQSPAPQNPQPTVVPFPQTSPSRPQSQNHNYSSPVRNPYSRSPIPQNNTYTQPQQSPMYAQSPANAGQSYSQMSPSGVFTSQSPAPNRFSQSPAPMGHPFSRSPIPQTQPYSRSPAPQGAPFPQHSPALAGTNTNQSYTPSPSHTPYSQHSSPAAAGANRTPAYANSPQFGGPSPLPSQNRRTEYGADLSSDISAAISSPGPVSPGIGHIDFEPPIAANKIRVGEGSSMGSQENSPMGSTDMHAGSNSNSSLSDFNKTGSGGTSEMSPATASAPGVGGGAPGGVGGGAQGGVGGVGGVAGAPGGVPGGAPYAMYEAERALSYMTHSPVEKHEHYHYPGQETGGSGVVSPRLEQLHSHPPIYPNTYNRSTPPGVGSPFSPHYRPPDLPPHTPGSPGEFPNTAKPKAQDVASKSLSGLESLVDQIPSIAEGPAAPPPGEPPPALPEPYPPLYPAPYGYNSYANNSAYGGLVGYGAGSWAPVMRPTPGYLGDWQYQYGGSYPPPASYPYYNGYSAPAPQQYLAAHHLSLDLHKAPEAGVPAVPSVPSMPSMPSMPSVGFGGFC